MLLKNAFKIGAVCVLLSVVIGFISALFLSSLSLVANIRSENIWIIWLLPFVGFFVGYIYHRYGNEANKGTNYILQSLENEKSVIPIRMAPLVFSGTVLSHLFGASAGREGTAVQVGGVVADYFRNLFQLKTNLKKLFLLCGITAGFSSVFGLPYAAIVFSLEVATWKKLNIWYIIPIAFCSLVSHWVCLSFGIKHLTFPTIKIPTMDFSVVLSVIIVGGICLLVGLLFVTLSKYISKLLQRFTNFAPVYPFIGGCILVIGYYIIGDMRFAGLGVSTIQNGFFVLQPNTDFALKLLFTAITIGSGFKGGEVTPLFFIGVTLASAIGIFFSLPLSFLAALCFVGVFSSATKLPFVSFVMALELFGTEGILWYLLVTYITGSILRERSIYNTNDTLIID